MLIVGADDKAIDIAREILARARTWATGSSASSTTIPRLQGVSLLNPRVIGTTTPGLRAGAPARGDAGRRRPHATTAAGVSMDALLACKTSGIRVQEGSSYYEQLTGKIMVEGLRKSWLVFSDGFVVSRGTLFAKRLLDVVRRRASAWSSPCLCMLLVALAVRLDSPGPVFFRQERVGRGGQRFTRLEVPLDAHRRRGGRRALGRSERDPRVTRVGRFIAPDPARRAAAALERAGSAT